MKIPFTKQAPLARHTAAIAELRKQQAELRKQTAALRAANPEPTPLDRSGDSFELGEAFASDVSDGGSREADLRAKHQARDAVYADALAKHRAALQQAAVLEEQHGELELRAQAVGRARESEVRRLAGERLEAEAKRYRKLMAEAVEMIPLLADLDALARGEKSPRRHDVKMPLFGGARDNAPFAADFYDAAGTLTQVTVTEAVAESIRQRFLAARRALTGESAAPDAAPDEFDLRIEELERRKAEIERQYSECMSTELPDEPPAYSDDGYQRLMQAREADRLDGGDREALLIAATTGRNAVKDRFDQARKQRAERAENLTAAIRAIDAEIAQAWRELARRDAA